MFSGKSADKVILQPSDPKEDDLDKQFLLPISANKEKDKIDKFFIITAAATIIDLVSCIFNALCKKFDQLQPAKIYVFWSVSSIFLAINFIFIYSSIKKFLEVKKYHDQKLISNTEFFIKGTAEVMSVSSGILYSLKGIFTLFLVLGISDELSKVVLAVGVLAPICDLIGTIVRAVDSYKYDNQSDVLTKNQKDRLKQRLSNPNFVLAICDSILAVFALGCAAIEIISLHGHAESTYDFDNMAVIYINISLCILYLALFTIHKFIDKNNDTHITKDNESAESLDNTPSSNNSLEDTKTENYLQNTSGHAA